MGDYTSRARRGFQFLRGTVTFLRMGLLGGRLDLPPTADFHVHLREGEVMEMVVPTIRQGGVDTVYVMVRGET